jgi:hypothetical protein
MNYWKNVDSTNPTFRLRVGEIGYGNEKTMNYLDRYIYYPRTSGPVGVILGPEASSHEKVEAVQEIIGVEGVEFLQQEAFRGFQLVPVQIGLRGNGRYTIHIVQDTSDENEAWGEVLSLK